MKSYYAKDTKDISNEWKEIYTNGNRVLKARTTGYIDAVQYQYFTLDGTPTSKLQLTSLSEIRMFVELAKVLLDGKKE